MPALTIVAVLATLALRAPQPARADGDDDVLSGAELVMLRTLDDPRQRIRHGAARQLHALPAPRAAVVLARGLRSRSQRVRALAAQEAARRNPPIAGLAPALLHVLRIDAIAPRSAAFVAARDAFFRLGSAAEAEYSRACQHEHLLDDAPQLADLFRRMAREALPAIVDGVSVPADGNGVVLMPWPGQLDTLCRPELLDALEELLLAGAQQSRESRSRGPLLTDLPPDVGRAALVAFALGEWAASHSGDARRVRETLKAAQQLMRSTWWPSSLHWIRSADDQLAFAIAAALYRAGDSDPLDRAWQSVSNQMRSLEANQKRSEVPRPWFILRLHHALLAWWRGDLAEAARLQADALDNLELTAGAGIERSVIAEACLQHARIQAQWRDAPRAVDGNDGTGATVDSLAERVARALDAAVGYGFADSEWLATVSDFQAGRTSEPFRKVRDRLARQRAGGDE
ncbi:MAG: hypothetical protein AB7S36_13505 [Planctomycetota bacterium]